MPSLDLAALLSLDAPSRPPDGPDDGPATVDVGRLLGAVGRQGAGERGAESVGLARLRCALEVEQTLRRAGWHPIGDVWLRVWADVLAGRRRRAVVRAGRRGGKSSSMIRLACGELIAGLRGIAHHTSAGDEMTGVIISARRDQALDRLTSLEKVLDACKIRHKRTYQKIQVLDSDFRFQVYTANKDSVVSQTTFYALCDEVARWYDDRTGLNPADEIVRSLNPSLLTDPDACMHLVSSPWVENDLHDRELRAACAHDARAGWWFPTWVGNPTVSEQMTRDEEADERVWSREFAAIPMAEDETSLFDKWAIDAAIEGEREL